MDRVDGDIQKLLRGEIISTTEAGVDVSYIPDEHASDIPLFVPKVKKTITYIVMAIVFDDQDRVVLVQEAKSSCRGKWYLPAGRVEKGENLIDAARREVLEEAGLEFEPLSFISATVFPRWCRFVYVGRSIGGKLKTLAEQDSESLQANLFTLEQIEMRMIPLRAKDIFKPIRLAYEYIKKSPETRHPCSSILIQPHKHLIHRPVIFKKSRQGSIEILCNKKNGLHIPSSYIGPSDMSLDQSICSILSDAFQVNFLGKAIIIGLLTMEHCGKPEEVHDGICFTTAVTFFNGYLVKEYETPKNSDYVWHSLTDSDVLNEFQKRVIEQNLLIPILNE